MDHQQPTFPPLLRGIAVAGGGDPFCVAIRKARSGAAGAGDLFWSEDNARLALAIVLEPEVSSTASLHMLFAVLLGLGDALAALAPPETDLSFRWPLDIQVNQARVGSLGAALPEGADGDSVPDWLVVAADLAVLPAPGSGEPGDHPERTSLLEEGFAEVTHVQLLEAASRHMLAWIHRWSEEGFGPLHQRWLAHAENHNETITLRHGGKRCEGVFTGLDEDGNLLLRAADGGMKALALMDAVRRGAGT